MSLSASAWFPTFCSQAVGARLSTPLERQEQKTQRYRLPLFVSTVFSVSVDSHPCIFYHSIQVETFHPHIGAQSRNRTDYPLVTNQVLRQQSFLGIFKCERPFYHVISGLSSVLSVFFETPYIPNSQGRLLPPPSSNPNCCLYLGIWGRLLSGTIKRYNCTHSGKTG